jgi:ornithine decarboxylase
VLELGVCPSRIIFANPAKMKSHIKAAQEAGVATMTFDNIAEIHKIKSIYPEAK